MDFTLTPIAAVAASGPGALAGFQADCSCGLVLRSSLRTIIEADVREHAAWHAGRPRPAGSTTPAQRASAAAGSCTGCEACDPVLAAAYDASLDAFYAEESWDRSGFPVTWGDPR